jgi:hypothetical protein
MSFNTSATQGDAPANNSMQRTALRAAADAGRYTDEVLTCRISSDQSLLENDAG